MPVFLALAALMLAAALAFALLPLLRTGGPRRAERALREARDAGVLSEVEFEARRAALAAAPPTGRALTSASILLVSTLLPAAALVLYRIVGTPAALDPAQLAAETAISGPQLEAAIAQLSARLEQEPGDTEGWVLLARAYQATERPQQALEAYRRAHETAPGHPGLAIEYVQAMALADPQRRIGDQGRRLLEHVLDIDPVQQRALWLLGIADLQEGRPDAAIARWNALLPLLEPGSDVAQSVSTQIREAEAMRDGTAPLPGAAPVHGIAAPSTADAPGDEPTAAPARLLVRVRLAPELAARAAGDATLFVFARAAEGPPMPLAIERLHAGALPAEIILDDSKGMVPGLALGQFPQVIVGARISASGDATPHSGDLQAFSAPVDPRGAGPVELVIDQVVP